MGNSNESRLIDKKKELNDESDCDDGSNCKTKLISFKYKIETSKFDQYFSKSSELQQYTNLDFTSRQLIYEGEIRWKNDVIIQELYAILFDDLLILLEIPSISKTKSKRQDDFTLKPLVSNPNSKKSAILSPVIPLKCIKSINNFSQDLGLFLTVFMDDERNAKKCKPYKTENFFILETKSECEKNQWKKHLLEQTIKYMPRNQIDVSFTDSAIDSASDLSSIIDEYRSKSKSSFSSQQSPPLSHRSNNSLVLLI